MKRVKAAVRLVSLYSQRVVKSVQAVMLQFDDDVATTDQQHERLFAEFIDLMEELQVLDEMIEQTKAEVFEK